jgi:hypothetical protein
MYNQLNNNTDETGTTLYYLTSHNRLSNPTTELYVHLPFYFFRNPSLAIPVCAITKQLVEIDIKFRDVDDDISFKYTSSNSINVRKRTTNGGIKNASIITDFYFVSEDERNFLLTRPIEYLITQLQVSKLVYKPNESKKSALLKFKNPVKEMFFMAKEEYSENPYQVDGEVVFENRLMNTTTNDQALTPLSTTIPGIGDTFQITKRGQNILGEAAGDGSGRSVSISSDGTRMAIGGEFNTNNTNSYSGHVRVFYDDDGTWTQVGGDIDGEAAHDKSGRRGSVSISSDGTRLAIGAYGNDGAANSAGHVRVYEDVSGTWTQMGPDIDGEAAGDMSGQSVSISSDGTRVAIGAPYNDAEPYAGHPSGVSAAGHVRVYDWNGSLWTQVGTDIDGVAADDRTGSSVSLSSDGTRMAIGSPRQTDSSLRSQVRMYEWSNVGGDWAQLGQGIDCEAPGDLSGYSLSMSSDGTRVAIGAINNDGTDTGNSTSYTLGKGQVRIFEYVSGTWTQVGSDIDGDAVGDQLGFSVSLSSDGTRVAIGAPGQVYNYAGTGGGDTGYVRIYYESSGSWIQWGSDINGEASGDHSGYSLSMSSDGTRVVIGAPSKFSATPQVPGYVRVYSLSGTSNSDQTINTILAGKRSDYRSIKNIKFDCNGETIFDQSGQYLAYEQSLRHHTGCPDPAYEFYMYSFSLQPEMYYPTGQLNMSRIIHKKIDVELEDVSSVSKTNLSIYAQNYNVLHVESGLAGLKF